MATAQLVIANWFAWKPQTTADPRRPCHSPNKAARSCHECRYHKPNSRKKQRNAVWNLDGKKSGRTKADADFVYNCKR